jgi:hypothetical protein
MQGSRLKEGYYVREDVTHSVKREVHFQQLKDAVIYEKQSIYPKALIHVSHDNQTKVYSEKEIQRLRKTFNV